MKIFSYDSGVQSNCFLHFKFLFSIELLWMVFWTLLLAILFYRYALSLSFRWFSFSSYIVRPFSLTTNLWKWIWIICETKILPRIVSSLRWSVRAFNCFQKRFKAFNERDFVRTKWIKERKNKTKKKSVKSIYCRNSSESHDCNDSVKQENGDKRNRWNNRV